MLLCLLGPIKNVIPEKSLNIRFHFLLLKSDKFLDLLRAIRSAIFAIILHISGIEIVPDNLSETE